MSIISVIVPVYKVEKYIHRCVDSILGQTYPDFELILVDDGSPDCCGAICEEYAQKDSRVVVIHQENGGLSAARNAGIDWAFAHSDSQWLTFIDSDDWIHPEYLQRLLDAATAHNVFVSICGYTETEGEELEAEPDTLISSLWNTEDFFVAHNVNATVAWGKLYRKECFQTIRYPVGKIHEDEYVTYRILFPLGKVACIPAGLYAYYVNNEGITKRPWNIKRLDAIPAFDAQRLYFKENQFHRAHDIAQWHLVYSIHTSISNLEKLNHTAQIRKLRRQLASLLFTYRKTYPFTRQNYWIYRHAYPKMIALFTTAFSIAGKIKRRLIKCLK